MNKFRLSDRSKQLLTAQTKLVGTFTHTLANSLGVSAQAVVTIDQCTAAIHVAVTVASTCNSITLNHKNRNNPRQVSKFIEASANGYASTGALCVGEHDLVDDVEVMLRAAVRLGRGTYYPGIEGLDDLNVALRPGQAGTLLASIEADDVLLRVLLPRDPRKAYTILAENLERFVAGHRAALIA